MRIDTVNIHIGAAPSAITKALISAMLSGELGRPSEPPAEPAAERKTVINFQLPIFNFH